MDTDIYYSCKKAVLGSFVNFNPGGVRIIVIWKAFPWLRVYAIANCESTTVAQIRYNAHQAPVHRAPYVEMI